MGWVEYQLYPAIPIFNVLPSNGNYPCSCENPDPEEDCNSFNFAISLIMYNLMGTHDYEDAQYMIPVYNLLAKYSQGNYSQLFVDAWNVTTTNPPFSDDVSKSFEFCYDEDTELYCVAATFNVINYFYTISDYQRQLRNGNCNDNFSLDDDAWNYILSHTPYDLQEQYASCHKSSSNVFVGASGIAIANTLTVVPIAESLLASAYFIYVKYFTPCNEEEIRKYNAKNGSFYKVVQDRVTTMVSNEILKEIHIRKYGESPGISSSQNHSIKNLVDAIEQEMARQYNHRSQNMDSTVETFGRITEKYSISNPMKEITIEMG